MKVDDSLDIVILIVLIAAILSVGLTAVLRERDRTTAYTSEYVNDKNTRRSLITQDVFGDEDGYYRIDDIYLTLQIQNYYMPQPKKIAVSYISKGNDGVASGTEVVLGPLDVTSLHEDERDVYCEFLNNFIDNYLLKGTTNKEKDLEALRFELDLDLGEDLKSSDDDFYVFRKVE